MKVRVVLYVLVAIALFHYCARKQAERDEVRYGTTLQEDEQEKIVFDQTRRTLLRVRRKVSDSHSGSGSSSSAELHLPSSYVTTQERGVRKAAITIKKSGEIVVVTKTKGFTFEPGLAIAQGERLVLGADVQWAYWKLWGTSAGIMFDQKGKGSLYVSANYNVWQNTSFFVALDHRKDLAVGVRLSF